jgi:hypothetical protein
MGENMSNSFDNDGPPPLQDGKSAEPAPQHSGPPPVPVVPCGRAETSKQEEIAEQGFSLSKSNGIYIGLVAVLCVVGFIAVPGKSAYEAGTVMGTIIGFCLFPLLFAWIFWRCTGRKAKAGHLAFNIILTLCLLGQVGRFIRKPREDQTLAEIQRKREAFREQLADTDDPSKLDSAFDDYVGSIKGDFDDLARNSSGPKRQAVKILRQDLTESVAAAEEWGESCTACQSAMVLDDTLLADDGEFDRRRSAVELYIKKTKDYSEYLANRVPALTKRMAALGKDNQFARGAIKGATDQYLRQKPLLDSLMQAHIDSGMTAIQLLDFLQENKDKWVYENDQVLFSSDSALAKFNELHSALLKSDEMIKTLSLKLVKVR